MRSSLLNRIRKREKELAAEREDLENQGLELDDVEIYLNRLEAGLLSLQLADYVLAWVCMEDDGVSLVFGTCDRAKSEFFTLQARDHAREVLTSQKSSFAEVIKVLQEYQDNIGDSSAGDADKPAKLEDGASASDVDAANKREIIAHLIAYLRSC